ncbi:hypothetical protein [Barnesiella sp. An55]|uniref:hypothetical protein n=1 Tax=Barnesiella sp. An55 TaxID=1965646 RepID=UPI000B36A89D|nr:hypothetical protein [Barnesiella sp. An55]OUN73225.1 hypothetical protein B5G10_05365 [Barnesiella sp. An55]HIZ25456.1 hypothetical protein [Candidatus Barnesiella merdipullorum]
MKKVATILSTLFHPLLMPTYGIAIALYTSYMRIFGDRLLGIIVIGVLLTTCILPSLGIYILYKTGHVSDFRLHERTERTVPYIINFACYIACYLYLYRFGIPGWILAFIAGAIVSLIIALFINRYWKISAHMVAAGSMVTLVFLMSFYGLMLTPYILPLQIAIVLLAGAIGSSRILLKRHTLGQVGAGFALGVLCCVSMFYIFV